MYESKLKEAKLSKNIWHSPYLLQSILIHLLELPDRDNDKLRYVLIAMEGSAKLCSFEEKMYYGKLLFNLIMRDDCSHMDQALNHSYKALLFDQNV